ncbi:hypothetical protein QTV44_002512 [Vibrio vulnificus]|nr:hypothetical protein [Vibrio vulnificus]
MRHQPFLIGSLQQFTEREALNVLSASSTTSSHGSHVTNYYVVDAIHQAFAQQANPIQAVLNDRRFDVDRHLFDYDSAHPEEAYNLSRVAHIARFDSALDSRFDWDMPDSHLQHSIGNHFAGDLRYEVLGTVSALSMEVSTQLLQGKPLSVNLVQDIFNHTIRDRALTMDAVQNYYAKDLVSAHQLREEALSSFNHVEFLSQFGDGLRRNGLDSLGLARLINEAERKDVEAPIALFALRDLTTQLHDSINEPNVRLPNTVYELSSILQREGIDPTDSALHMHAEQRGMEFINAIRDGRGLEVDVMTSLTRMSSVPYQPEEQYANLSQLFNAQFSDGDAPSM